METAAQPAWYGWSSASSCTLLPRTDPKAVDKSASLQESICLWRATAVIFQETRATPAVEPTVTKAQESPQIMLRVLSSFKGVTPTSVEQWHREGEWWIRHDKTTKSLARLRMDAIKALQWGLPALTAKPEWKDSNTLHITSGLGPPIFDVAEGYVLFEPGQITCRVRFKLPLASFLLKDKTLSDVGAMALDVAGKPFDSKEVFIVHGHSENARAQLKALLTALGLQPVILSEQTHHGRTIIEELEHYSKTCSFAIVLMTPDDVVGEAAEKSLRRARQNVILELGWFMGRLGRENVILMSQGEVELPSDVHGVLYLPFKTDLHEVAAEISRQLRDVGLL